MVKSCTIWYMTIEQHVTITRTATQVWATLSDIGGWPEWLPTVDAVVPEGGEPAHSTGAVYVVTQPRLGTARWVVTQWEPGVSFTWESRRPGVVTTATHVLTPTGNGDDRGCSATLGIEWTGPFAGVARLVYGRLTRSYLAQEAEALRQRVEAG